MVTTRRSTRLQEKSESAGSAEETSLMTPSPKTTSRGTGSRSTSARKSTRSSTPRAAKVATTKARAATKRGGRRSAAVAAEAEEPEAEDSDADDSKSYVNEEKSVAKELFKASDGKQEESEAATEDVSEETNKATTAAEPAASVAAVEQKEADKVEEKDDDEEDEIVMMPDDSDEEEEASGDEEDNAQAADDAGADEDDIANYAIMAASGLQLTSSKATTGSDEVLMSKPDINLVPDVLDSGSSSHTKYFAFKGRKCSQGVELVTQKSSEEEKLSLQVQLKAIAHSNQQRTESKNHKSAGRKWFDMASDEMTPDARRDFALLRMRNYLDPKKFYKSSDHGKNLPKHFQIGTVIEGAHEFHSARLTKKERQKTFTDEIMADENIRSYTKRVFSQVQAANSGQGRKKSKAKHIKF